MKFRTIDGPIAVEITLAVDEAKTLLNYLYWGTDILEEAIGDDPGMSGMGEEDVAILNQLTKTLKQHLKL